MDGLKWYAVNNGVQACRKVIDEGLFEIEVTPREIVWVTCIDGSVDCNTPAEGGPASLSANDSSLLFWPRGEWKLRMSTSGHADLVLCRITLEALHDMLAVEFDASATATPRFDYKQLARIVHFSPVRTRDLSRMFIVSSESMFKRIARRGIFLDIFAEMLEMLYGVDVAQCPFQIDADTEKKIRRAHKSLVSNLNNMPDLTELAIDVDLPKEVLKEGFNFIYGKTMSDYVNDYRFEQARVMLESGQYLIKQVAFHIGYQNPSHFISAFKQRYGITPKQWVKQQAQTAS